MRKIHWLASYPKSGNTWVRLFLAAYRYGVTDINQAAELLRGDNNLAAYQMASPKPVADLTTHEALALRQAALMHLVAMHVANPVVVKTHNAAATLNGVELCWEPMSAGAVYLVRDPRDVALSYARHVGHSVDDTIHLMGQELARTDTHGTGVAHFLSSWSTHVASWREREGVTVVRYEDLLAEPVEQFMRIVHACGLTVDRPKVEEAVEDTRFDRLRAQERDHGFLEQSNKNDSFFHKGRAGRWREELTEAQVARLERDHGEMMAMLGYELVAAKEAC